MPKPDILFDAIGWLVVLAMAGGGAVFAMLDHSRAWDVAQYGALAGLALGGLSVVVVAWLLSVLWR